MIVHSGGQHILLPLPSQRPAVLVADSCTTPVVTSRTTSSRTSVPVASNRANLPVTSVVSSQQPVYSGVVQPSTQQTELANQAIQLSLASEEQVPGMRAGTLSQSSPSNQQQVQSLQAGTLSQSKQQGSAVNVATAIQDDVVPSMIMNSNGDEMMMQYLTTAILHQEDNVEYNTEQRGSVNMHIACSVVTSRTVLLHKCNFKMSELSNVL